MVYIYICVLYIARQLDCLRTETNREMETMSGHRLGQTEIYAQKEREKERKKTKGKEERKRQRDYVLVGRLHRCPRTDRLRERASGKKRRRASRGGLEFFFSFYFYLFLCVQSGLEELLFFFFKFYFSEVAHG